MVSFARMLARVKDDFAVLFSVEHLERLCRDGGMKWRDRVLSPAVTIQIFLLQVLHGNTACTHVSRLAGLAFSASGWCQARMRLPLAVLRTLLHQSAETRGGIALESRTGGAPAGAWSGASPVGAWRGHRTFLIDGSSCSMPDTPALRKRFGQPTGQKKGCGFPVAHLLMLFDAQRGRLLDVLISSWTLHDLTRVAELHSWLKPGDVLVADRGFCSYAHIASLARIGVQVVLRMHQAQIVDFRPHRRVAAHDADKGRSAPARSSADGPNGRRARRLGVPVVFRMQQAQIVDFRPRRRAAPATAAAKPPDRRRSPGASLGGRMRVAARQCPPHPHVSPAGIQPRAEPRRVPEQRRENQRRRPKTARDQARAGRQSSATRSADPTSSRTTSKPNPCVTPQGRYVQCLVAGVISVHHKSAECQFPTLQLLSTRAQHVAARRRSAPNALALRSIC